MYFVQPETHCGSVNFKPQLRANQPRRHYWNWKNWTTVRDASSHMYFEAFEKGAFMVSVT
jgi:hypothetical protein